MFEKEAKKIVNIGWHHGRYLDLWSICHLLSGSIIGIAFILLHIPFVTGLIVASMLFIVYEVLEFFLRVVEDIQNSIADVVIGAIGFYVTHLILRPHT